jgi:hypothetical protein
VPARSNVKEFKEAAADMGITLLPWQVVAARYITALGAGGRWLYREVCVVVARQNGKTELLLPRILLGLMLGRRMLHTAQVRALPEQTFRTVARLLNGHPDVVEIRFANGQELIRTANGGTYALVAPRNSVRGLSADDVFIDEVREQSDFDLIAAIKPTMTASRNPQIIYLSNAGDEDSVVLNDLRRRADVSPQLAYLEWSAAPERTLGDWAGWAEANPALGHFGGMADNLHEAYRTLVEAGTAPAKFETEHLCRWVRTMRPRLVAEAIWEQAAGPLDKPLRPALGISIDPAGKRASAMLAWQQSDGSLGLRGLAEVYGDPIDIGAFAKALRVNAIRAGVAQMGFDDWTDKELVRHLRLPNAKPVMGREFANACEAFVRALEGRRLRWADAGAIGADLPWVARKPYEETGAWVAVRAIEDRPVTAVLAAVRAVWLAISPTGGAGKPRVR